ncbi:MAG TPA: hypothetical protein DCE55_20950, partial [Planctomycetaceae bacterium]|nr:hypothetical protein [Planctomycetaceae bacterium]
MQPDPGQQVSDKLAKLASNPGHRFNQVIPGKLRKHSGNREQFPQAPSLQIPAAEATGRQR